MNQLRPPFAVPTQKPRKYSTVKNSKVASGVAACANLHTSRDVTVTTPASTPVAASNIRRPSSYTSNTVPIVSSADGRRAAHSLSPKAA